MWFGNAELVNALNELLYEGRVRVVMLDGFGNEADGVVLRFNHSIYPSELIIVVQSEEDNLRQQEREGEMEGRE